MKLCEGEKKVIGGLKKLGGKAFTKKIADASELSPQTTSKYLMLLEARGLIKKDSSQPPHIHWELKKEGWDNE